MRGKEGGGGLKKDPGHPLSYHTFGESGVGGPIFYEYSPIF